DPLQPLRLPTAWVGALAQWIVRVESAPRSLRSPLIIQGEADMTVDWSHNLAILKEQVQPAADSDARACPASSGQRNARAAGSVL
ncbi:hypothetical protein PSYPI_31521, partial [Pseudomonas syringae pv. pisi str. 1704B]